MQLMDSAQDQRRKVGIGTIEASNFGATALLGKLAEAKQSVLWLVTEILVLPLIALALGLWFSPDDPLWIHSEFGWSWLAPIVVALRYGTLAGLASSTILLTGWILLNKENLENFPQLYFLGGVITVMLIGELSTALRNKARRAELAQHYLDQRLEHLIRQYYLLRISHDRLEQELIGRPISMRDALHKLKEIPTHQNSAKELLYLLAQYCQVNSAGIYSIKNGKIESKPIAQIGSIELYNFDDPLIQQSLQLRKLSHIAQATDDSVLHIAAPLLDANGDPYAILLVSEIPFFALHDENLQVINLLLSYYSESEVTQALAAPILVNYPQCPLSFAAELQKLSHLHARTGLDSVIISLNFSEEAIKNQIPQQIIRMKRQLDEYWLIELNESEQTLAILMPLGNSSTAEGYLERIKRSLSQQTVHALDNIGVYTKILQVGSSPALDIIKILHGKNDA